MLEQKRITRWSGADWASELRDITMIGAGGINSWTALNISRIGHSITIFDADLVDETNVQGGQMFRKDDVGLSKVDSVENICRMFGCTNEIFQIESNFDKEDELDDAICICGVDNMKARKEVFEAWLKGLGRACSDGTNPSIVNDYLFIDGRLTMEMYEVFCIQGNKEEQIKEYQREHLFSDAEANELDCTVKQSTFSAMGISSMITSVLCNWLTNRKLGMELREVPFYQRMLSPIFYHKKSEIGRIVVEESEPVKPKRKYIKKSKIISS